MRTRIAAAIVVSAAIAATTAFAHGFGGGHGYGPGGHMGCGMGYGAGPAAGACDTWGADVAQRDQMRSEMQELRRLASTEGTGSAAYEAQARKVEQLRLERREARSGDAYCPGMTTGTPAAPN